MDAAVFSVEQATNGAVLSGARDCSFLKAIDANSICSAPIVCPELPQPKGSRPMRSTLPFIVKLARTEEGLRKAVSIRASAYGRHVPSLAETLVEPEHIDRQRGTVVFVAEDKDGGAPLGTMRIQTNHNLPLKIEQSVRLPETLLNMSLVEVTRLGVASGSKGPLVKFALFKALLRYCVATQIDWIVIAARTPLDRMYEKLAFADLVAPGTFIPMPHIGNIPHRVLGFEVMSAERRSLAIGHPLHDFMFRQFHPDIEIFSSVSSSWERPRQRKTTPMQSITPLDIPLV